MPASVDKNMFRSMYSGQPPWDIGRPQPAFTEVADQVTGFVLDVGCGTGENAMYLASKSRKVTGIDFLEEAIRRARRKATERGLSVTFLVKDATDLKGWSERFDNVIDCGLFHGFSDEDRKKYVDGLATILKPGGRLFLMCFSDEEPGTIGPRRVTQKELRDAFAEGWVIESIKPSQFEVVPLKDFTFSEGGPKAWFIVVEARLIVMAEKQITRLVPDEPLPPYAFVPGRSPHPTSDPAGHSYGKEEAVPPKVDPERWHECRPYLYGIDLFNGGYYWESHVAWESLWIACGRKGIVADFLKGLIKLAAAGVKALEGKPEGVKVRIRAVQPNFGE